MVKEFITRVFRGIPFVEPTSWKSRLVIILAVMVPYVLVTGYNLVAYQNVLRAEVYGHRTAVVELAERLVTTKMDRLKELAVSYAARPDVIQYAKAGKSDETNPVLGEPVRSNPDIIGVVFITPDGRNLAVFPPDPEVIGGVRTERQWYKDIVASGRPVVSEVFKRGIHPQVNIVSVVVPIRDEQNSIVGYLGFQVSLQRISSWFTDIDVGTGGYIYVVDQVGHLIVHPKFDLTNDLVDFSAEPVVIELLNGKSGSMVNFSEAEKEEELSTYTQVPGYRWGIVFQQPERNAFAAYYSSLMRMMLVDGVIGLLILLLVLFGARMYASVHDIRQRERVFLDSISDGILAIDRNWKITLWNTKMEDFTDITSEEAMGQNFKDIVKLLRVSDKKVNVIFIEEAMLEGEKRSLEDLTVIVDKGGNEVPVSSSVIPIRNGNNVVIGCIITLRNTTEELLLEKRKTDLIASVIQEMKTPLTIINSVARQFDDAREKITQLIPDMAMGISLIVDSSQKITLMVDELLDKIESKDLRPKLTLDLTTMLARLRDRLLPVVASSKIVISYEPRETPVNVLVDDLGVVESSFAGLLDNAVRSSRAGGQIFISHEVVGRYLKTIIRDNGLGISKEDMLKIFSPVLKVESTVTPNAPQLELLTIKNSIEANGGVITIESEPGAGTTVSVYLPFV